jgi:Uncharacterized protein conserved in bacteria (DUF2188)
MTVGLIALFASFAVCALIGWAFVRAMGVIARSVRRQPEPPVRRASNPTIVLRGATAQELAEKARITGETELSRNVETYFENGRWKNKIQGNSRASHVHETRTAAISAGREMARKRKVEHIIMGTAGTVVKRDSHRHDPRPVGG